jgi:hypothetical protein
MMPIQMRPATTLPLKCETPTRSPTVAVLTVSLGVLFGAIAFRMYDWQTGATTMVRSD